MHDTFFTSHIICTWINMRNCSMDCAPVIDNYCDSLIYDDIIQPFLDNFKKHFLVPMDISNLTQGFTFHAHGSLIINSV